MAGTCDCRWMDEQARRDARIHAMRLATVLHPMLSVSFFFQASFLFVCVDVDGWMDGEQEGHHHLERDAPCRAHPRHRDERRVDRAQQHERAVEAREPVLDQVLYRELLRLDDRVHAPGGGEDGHR